MEAKLPKISFIALMILPLIAYSDVAIGKIAGEFRTNCIRDKTISYYLYEPESANILIGKEKITWSEKFKEVVELIGESKTRTKFQSVSNPADADILFSSYNLGTHFEYPSVDKFLKFAGNHVQDQVGYNKFIAEVSEARSKVKRTENGKGYLKCLFHNDRTNGKFFALSFPFASVSGSAAGPDCTMGQLLWLMCVNVNLSDEASLRRSTEDYFDLGPGGFYKIERGRKFNFLTEE